MSVQHLTIQVINQHTNNKTKPANEVFQEFKETIGKIPKVAKDADERVGSTKNSSAKEH